MKQICWIVFTSLLFMLTGCETENKKYYAGDFVNPEVKAPQSGSDFILTETTANDSLTVAWTTAEFGFPAATLYTVQVAKAGTYFESAVKIAETQEKQVKVDYATLNNSILIAGLVPETPGEIELRVNAMVNENLQTLRSKAVQVTMTAYNVEVTYPILFAPGSYQGWNPGDSATILTSPKADDIYEGYLYFIPNTSFKITGQPDWNPLQWGSGGAGKLQKNGGDISVNNSSASLYKVIADINKLTYSVTPVSWSISGSATSNTAIPLTYNESDRTLKTTAHLMSGEFVFKETGAGNRILGVYFGNQLMDNGNQIVVPQEGEYTITLNLKKYPYTYILGN